jgi:hypothetical protein
MRWVKVANGKVPYYEIFSFWGHNLLLINDCSVQAAKKCNNSLPIVILGQDSIIYYYLRTKTVHGMGIRSYWDTSIKIKILLLPPWTYAVQSAFQTFHRR